MKKKKTSHKNPVVEKVAKDIAEVMIEAIESKANGEWQKPWFTVKWKDCYPKSITGYNYRGGNIMFLLFVLMMRRYRLPIFMTFKYAQENGISIMANQKSYPVYYFLFTYYNYSTKQRISEEEFEELPESQKSEYRRMPHMKQYRVFNLDQTDYAEKYPEEWDKLLKEYCPDIDEEKKDTKDMFSLPLLDNMLTFNEWICPIKTEVSNSAYFSPSDDYIMMPEKYQFRDGQSFYATLLHEMAHSTGKEGRLDRIKPGNTFGSEAYGVEELIAEMSSATLGYFMGVESTIREDHVLYLKSWVTQIKKEPLFIMDILKEVIKVVNLTSEHLNFPILSQQKTSDNTTKKKKKNTKVMETEELMVVEE